MGQTIVFCGLPGSRRKLIGCTTGLINWLVFRITPGASMLAGGACIVLGGAIIAVAGN